MYGQTSYSGPILLALISILFIAWHVGLYKIFIKAGKDGWKAFVPVVNLIELYKITGRPTWQVVYWFIPIVNVFAFINVSIDLYRSFGKAFFQEYAVGILFPYYYIIKLGFSEKEKYHGQGHHFPKHQKTTMEEWRDSILFAVVAATLIRWMVMELYTIPTPSMEKSLLVGDYLFVSKLHYGPRTPQTPLQLPFTHQYMWGSQSIPSYLEWIQLPMYRLPGFQDVERGDAVVFNWPGDHHHPKDLRTHYIKRCIGMPNDTLQLINRQVYINGKPMVNPEKLQWQYYVLAQEEIDLSVFKRYDIASYDIATPMKQDLSGPILPYEMTKDGKYIYGLHMTPKTAASLKEDGLILKYELSNQNYSDFSQTLFPNNMISANWSVDTYGKIWIPKKGATIAINYTNLQIYSSTIQEHEGWDEVRIDTVYKTVQNHKEPADLKLFINGQAVTGTYTFQRNYYFMMGDNRHNSLDSRFWGFVPDDHIVGKALFILTSFDQDRSGFKSIRWERMFRLISNK